MDKEKLVEWLEKGIKYYDVLLEDPEYPGKADLYAFRQTYLNLIDRIKAGEFDEQENETVTLDALCSRIHKTSLEKGYWNPNNWTPELCMFAVKAILIISEVIEMFEAYRENPNKKDEHIPELPAIEVEAADIIIRTLGFSSGLGFDIKEAILAKMEHNETTDRRKRF